MTETQESEAIVSRFRARAEVVWRRLEDEHGDPAAIDGAWCRGLKPKQIVENVLRAADYEGRVDLVHELGSAWRADDMKRAGAALARLEDAVGLREQGGTDGSGPLKARTHIGGLG